MWWWSSQCAHHLTFPPSLITDYWWAHMISLLETKAFSAYTFLLNKFYFPSWFVSSARGVVGTIHLRSFHQLCIVFLTGVENERDGPMSKRIKLPIHSANSRMVAPEHSESFLKVIRPICLTLPSHGTNITATERTIFLCAQFQWSCLGSAFETA